jgi:hypothetical protein
MDVLRVKADHTSIVLDSFLVLAELGETVSTVIEGFKVVWWAEAELRGIVFYSTVVFLCLTMD